MYSRQYFSARKFSVFPLLFFCAASRFFCNWLKQYSEKWCRFFLLHKGKYFFVFLIRLVSMWKKRYYCIHNLSFSTLHWALAAHFQQNTFFTLLDLKWFTVLLESDGEVNRRCQGHDKGSCWGIVPWNHSHEAGKRVSAVLQSISGDDKWNLLWMGSVFMFLIILNTNVDENVGWKIVRSTRIRRELWRWKKHILPIFKLSHMWKTIKLYWKLLLTIKTAHDLLSVDSV